MSSTANSPKTPQEIRNHLNLHHCTEAYHRHGLVPPEVLVFTDGAVAAAKLMECWWLLDAIASYQYHRKLQVHSLTSRFVVWRMTTRNGGGMLTAHADWDSKNHSAFPPFLSQKIHATTFPLPEFTLWQEGNVLLLPSEH